MNNYKCTVCEKIFESSITPHDTQLKCPNCGADVSDKDEILPSGFEIGGFVIDKLIGQGGMGCVYLAKQTSLDRSVALKILNRSVTSNKEAVGQFLAEVKSTGQLSHRNLVTALEAGEQDGLYFMAMKHIDGCDLDKRLDAGESLVEEAAIDIVIKVASALDYVQKKLGLFHKDIKPGNIMMDKNGETYLLDLGIAQLAGDQQVRTGKVVGSPYYMSPEQTRNEKLDWRSDQYSLGATLYHILVGVPPFDDTSIPNILKLHNSEPFPEPTSRNPKAKVSKGCVKLLGRMMEKIRDDRFPSWEEFIAEAKEVLATGGKLPDKKGDTARSTGKGSALKKPALPRLSTQKLNAPPIIPTSPRPPAEHSHARVFVISGVILAVLAIIAVIIISASSSSPQPVNSDIPAEQSAQNLRNGACEIALVKAKQMFSDKYYQQAASLVSSYSDISDPILNAEVAKLISEAQAAIDKAEQEKNAEKEKAANEVKKLAEKAEAAEKAKAQELLRIATDERNTYEAFIGDALQGIVQRDMKSLAALAGKVKSNKWDAMAEDAHSLAAIIVELSLVDQNILDTLKKKKGEPFNVNMNGNRQITFKIKSIEDNSIKGFITQANSIKSKPFSFELADLAPKEQLDLSGIQKPQSKAILEAVLLCKLGDYDSAAAAADGAGLFKNHIVRLIADKDSGQLENDAEKAFYAILHKYFNLTYEKHSLKKVEFDLETAKPKTDSPWAARCDARSFAGKFAKTKFAQQYKQSIENACNRIWKDLPITIPDMFKASSVKFNQETYEITLDYDFSDPRQAEDWGAAAVSNGEIICDAGKAAMHLAVFDSAYISANITPDAGEAGFIMISKSSDSQLIFKAVSSNINFTPEASTTVDESIKLLFRGEPTQAPALPDTPVSLKFSHDTATATIVKTKLSATRKDFDFIQVGISSYKGKGAFGNVKISGVINKNWVKAPFDEFKENAARKSDNDTKE